MPNPEEGRLEVYEDMVEVLLVLDIFLTHGSQVDDLLCGATSCCEACLFFSDDLLRLWLKSVQNDFQCEFAWVTGVAGPSVDCRESGDYILSTCLDHFCWAVVDSSWLPFLPRLYCSLHFFARDGAVILCVCLGTVQYWWIPTGLLIVQLSAVFCPSVQHLSFFCEAFSWTILDNNSFSSFTVVKFFTRWYALLLLFFLGFSSILLQFSPTKFSFAFFMHLLMLLFTSLYFLDISGPFFLLSQFLPSVAQTKNLRNDPGCYFIYLFNQLVLKKKCVWVCVSSDDVCQGLHWLFRSLLCWRWWSLNPGLYPYCSWWWEVQTSRLSYLGRFPTHWDFSANRGQTWVLCVLACWLFSDEVEGRHKQVVVTSNVCFWKKKIVFWQCSRSGCGVVHLSHARFILLMFYDDQECSPTQDR